MNRIAVLLFSVFLLGIIASCECEQERTRRLLTNPYKISECKGWNLVKLYQKEYKTMEYKKKHVLLFAANGYFNALFWRGENQKFQETGSSCIVLTDEQKKAKHSWQWGNRRELILSGDTARIERITKDTLILRDYPVKDGRAIYVRKTDFSDVSFKVQITPMFQMPVE